MPERAHPLGGERAGPARAAAALRRELTRAITVGVAVVGAAIAGACDQGSQRNESSIEGPNVNVTAASVGPNAKLNANGAVQLQFDRMLLPITVTRQTILLVDADNNALAPVVTYDPVARVVTLSRQAGGADAGAPQWLKPDLPYKVLVRPPSGDDLNGVRAVDGAPVNTIEPIGFLTEPNAPQPFAEPQANFCNDVLPIFQRSCTAPICHGAPAPTSDKSRFGDQGISKPAAGLILESSEGVRNTAFRVANGSNTGPRAKGSEPRRVFGVDLPVIDPGSPGNSWLMYKLLLAKPGDPAKVSEARRLKCDGTPGTPPMPPLSLAAPLAAATPSDGERAILSDFVLGREMPYPDMGLDGPHDSNPGLTYGELERIRLWIAQGANLLDCGACEP